MELTIIEDKKNPLLERRDVFGKISYSGATPKKEDVEKLIAEKMKTKTTKIDLVYLKSSFGKTEADFKARIYDKDIKEEKKEEVKEEASSDEAQAEEKKEEQA